MSYVHGGNREVLLQSGTTDYQVSEVGLIATHFQLSIEFSDEQSYGRGNWVNLSNHHEVIQKSLPENATIWGSSALNTMPQFSKSNRRDSELFSWTLCG